MIRIIIDSPLPDSFTLEACGADDELCRQVMRATDNAWLAGAANWLIAKPLAILVIVVVGLLLRWVANRVVDRVVNRASGGVFGESGRRPRLGRDRQEQAGLTAERRRQRASTMGSVLKSVASFAIFTVVTIMVVAELGYDVGPLIASAGIVGLALGFGAQSLVKDFLSGMFMFFEDQLGVGDEVVLGDTKGVVEALTLRVTRLRAEDGTVWYIRNGEILKVGNQSQALGPRPAEVDG